MSAAFPAGFEERIKALLPKEGEQLLEALNARSPVSVRLNPKKQNLEVLKSYVEAQVPWSTQGYYLSERPSFTFDPLFHAGAYYVQEASSMFVEEAVRQLVDLKQDLKVLDLCAAPGGKSTLLLSLLTEGSLLIANEPVPNRAAILVENIMKWGAKNAVVTNNEPADFSFLKGAFDLVLVDAPCSGEGMFRKDKDSRGEWSPEAVRMCAARQDQILEQAKVLLAPGGLLLYTTCTFSKEENEGHFEQFKEGFIPQRIELKENWGIEESIIEGAYGYHFYPHKAEGEGFFLMAFKKKGDAEKDNWPYTKKGLPPVSKKQETILAAWLAEESKSEAFLFQEQVLLLPKDASNSFFALLNTRLRIKMMGVEAGTFYRDDFAPAQHIALTDLLRSDIPSLELDKEEAIRYLQKKDLLQKVGQRGWLKVSYRGLSLGWLKCLGNRSNNYYPKEWRIRSEA